MDEFRIGTTTIALTYTDGIIIAVDSQTVTHNEKGMTFYGSNETKMKKINNYFVGTIAGRIASGQHVLNYLAGKYGKGDSVVSSEVANCAYNYMQEKYYQGIEDNMIPLNELLTILIAAWDLTVSRPIIYRVDHKGIKSTTNYFCTGSGSRYALPEIERRFAKGLKLGEALELVRYAMYKASVQDIGTGGFMHVTKVTSHGVEVRPTESFYDLSYVYKHKTDKDEKEKKEDRFALDCTCFECGVNQS